MSETSPKRLYRSRSDRLIGGVCGGMGKYFNVDPVWMRILFLIFLIAAGVTLLIYIILWIIIPEEPIQSPRDKNSENVNKS